MWSENVEWRMWSGDVESVEQNVEEIWSGDLEM